jgi:hypothetical protein
MHITLDDQARAEPRQIAPQMCFPEPLPNGDFQILGNSEGQPVGDGINEMTEWTFDFSDIANVEDFRLDPEADLDFAGLELYLTPGRSDVRNDTVQILGLPVIPLIDTDVVRSDRRTVWDPRGEKAVIAWADLLQFYEEQEILDVLSQHEYRLPMLYQEDSILHEARLVLEQWDRMYLAKFNGSRFRIGPTDWGAKVEIVVRDTRGNVVSGAIVEAAWDAEISRPDGAKTDERGFCSMHSGDISPKIDRITFTVLEVSHDGYLFDPTAHPELGSEAETSVTFERPEY